VAGERPAKTGLSSVAAPPVVAREPKPAPPETVQKQPDLAQGDHDTAKTQKRAKRLRDPEKEPF
jgi:hypothetical protein